MYSKVSINILGVYERGPAGYKHIYFNVTSNTLKIWAVTVFFILLVYEAAKRTIKLLIFGSVSINFLIIYYIVYSTRIIEKY